MNTVREPRNAGSPKGLDAFVTCGRGGGCTVTWDLFER